MPMSREIFWAKNWSGESAGSRGSFFVVGLFFAEKWIPKKNYRKEILRKKYFKFASENR